MVAVVAGEFASPLCLLHSCERNLREMMLANEIPNAANLTSRTRELLDEGRAGAVKREESAFDVVAEGQPDSLLLFGAGNLGRTTLGVLRTIDLEPLAFTHIN